MNSGFSLSHTHTQSQASSYSTVTAIIMSKHEMPLSCHTLCVVLSLCSTRERENCHVMDYGVRKEKKKSSLLGKTFLHSKVVHTPTDSHTHLYQ